MDILDKIAAKTGNTPLIDVSQYVGPRVRAFAKCEYLNLTGSHYDRVYLELFRRLEARGQIERGKTHLLEVSTGSAGASFAWFCGQLGYEATVVVPHGLPQSAIKYIKTHNPLIDILEGDKGDYLKGAFRKAGRLLAGHRKWVHLNHSGNDISLIGSSQIAREAIGQLQEYGINRLDRFIAARGTGTTIVGAGKVLKAQWPDMRLVAFEEAMFDRTVPRALFCTVGRELALHGDFSGHFPFLQEPRFGYSDPDLAEVSKSGPAIDEALALQPQLARRSLNIGNSSLIALAEARLQASLHPESTMLMPFYDNGAKYGRGFFIAPTL